MLDLIKRIKTEKILYLFLLIGLILFGAQVSNFLVKFLSPVQKLLWQKGTILNSPSAELQDLRQRNKELLSENFELRSLKKENKTLRQALDLKLQQDFELILANITGKDSAQDIILIDKGTKDGVEIEDPVVSSEKVLVGKVKKVFPDFSKVILISHPQMSFSARVSEKKAKGIVKGKGKGQLWLKLTPREVSLENGDLVTTDILGKTFPEGLLVGTVKGFKRSDIEPFQKTQIKPFLNLDQTTKAFLLKEW